IFEPVMTSTLADGVETSLIRFIRNRTMQPGDLLPKEEEIAQELQVSRLSVREGIGRLKALGVLEPRKRRGTALRRPDPFLSFSKIASTNLFCDEDRQNFIEMRIALELGMCEWIYMRKTKEQLRTLRQIAGNFANAASDAEFHTYLMKMSGNRGMREFQEVMANFFKYPKAHDQAFWQKVREEHLELCDVLEHGTSMDFYAAMRKHFQPYFNKMQSTQSAKGEEPK
ncbi:MAG: FadR family transcriptional regulator, partial [Victivallales bacterium]|nr:FadR family transcriptional regulator [Victivallales bacterium]